MDWKLADTPFGGPAHRSAPQYGHEMSRMLNSAWIRTKGSIEVSISVQIGNLYIAASFNSQWRGFKLSIRPSSAKRSGDIRVVIMGAIEYQVEIPILVQVKVVDRSDRAIMTHV